jgi:hypothetical protein
MNAVLAFLSENRQRLQLQNLGVPQDLSCILMTPRFRASRHVVYLIIPVQHSEPVLVAKVPRLPEPGGVELEAQNIAMAQSSRVGGFNSIPRLVAYEAFYGRSILVETALVGQPLDPSAIRADRHGCCEGVLRWITDFHTTTSNESQSDPTWFTRLVMRPLEVFETAFPCSSEERQLLEKTRSLVNPLQTARLPLVFEHGDLSHPNLFRMKSGDVGVVDWELALPKGLPACDLFFFLTYAAFSFTKARETKEQLRAFHTAFWGQNAWAQTYIRPYAGRLGLSKEELVPLFILCWTRYMIQLLDRLGSAEPDSQTIDAATATWLRSNRYYSLWRHTLEHIDELGQNL